MVVKKYYGLEIEFVYNSQKINNIKIGDYHEGIKGGKYWKFENDGSIKTYLNLNDWKNWGCSCEAVSNRLDSKNKIIEALEEFKKIFSNNGQYELNEILDFNRSCGLHIHISFFKSNMEFKFVDYLDSKTFIYTRRRLFNDIRKSCINSKCDILKHYNRPFAKKLKNNELDYRDSGDRYKEFNFDSEYSGKGFEWRSPNLLNIKTWVEFDNLISIYLKHADFMLKKLIKNKVNTIEVIEFEDIVNNDDVMKEEKINIVLEKNVQP